MAVIFQDGFYFSRWRLFFKMAVIFQDGGYFSRPLKRERVHKAHITILNINNSKLKRTLSLNVQLS